MQQDPLADARIRAARYWTVDGLNDTMMGLWVLLVALCQYGITRTSRGSIGRLLLVLTFAFGLPALLLLSGRLLVAIRRRVTYPRTGFVAYQRDPRSWMFGAALAAAIAALLVALMMSGVHWVAFLFVIQGVVPGALIAYFGRVVRLNRFQVLGAIYMLAGVAVAAAGLDLADGMIVFWAGMGAVHLVAGAVTFWRYVRLHPRIAEAQ